MTGVYPSATARRAPTVRETVEWDASRICYALPAHTSFVIADFGSCERSRAVDGLSDMVKWIFVFVVGLSPILTFWMASVLWNYLRRTAALKKRLPQSQTRQARTNARARRSRDGSVD